MSKHEFIETLQASLNRDLAPSLVADHIKYYEEYIRSRVALGESEREVLNSLGDPRLIARTIVENNARMEGTTGGDGSIYRDVSYSEGSYRESAASRQSRDGEIQTSHRLPSWLHWLLIVCVIILVFSLVISVVSFLVPILIPVLVILFLVKMFRDWLI